VTQRAVQSASSLSARYVSTLHFANDASRFQLGKAEQAATNPSGGRMA